MAAMTQITKSTDVKLPNGLSPNTFCNWSARDSIIRRPERKKITRNSTELTANFLPGAIGGADKQRSWPARAMAPPVTSPPVEKNHDSAAIAALKDLPNQ